MEGSFTLTEHDLADIFRNVWGYTAPPYLFSVQNRLEASIFESKFSDASFSFSPKNEERSSLQYEMNEMVSRREYNIKGVPFYSSNHNGNEVFMPVWLIRPDGSRLLLQNTVMSLLSRKTIVETPLVNCNGSVKEEISIDDWSINVKGVIVSTDFDYPDEPVAELNELKNMSVALGIENARTSLVLEGAEKVVIKSLSFPELKQMRNVQPFELNLVSDVPFKLIIE